MITRALQDMSLVIAGHGERGGARTNSTLIAHAAAVRQLVDSRCVTWGVLKGERSLEEALAEAHAAEARHILVYPFFMADGYFVGTVLPDRIRMAGLDDVCRILTPLGLESRLPALMLAESLRATRAAGLDARATRLLVAGHGSKFGPASARATRRAAAAVARACHFAHIDTAFLEEAPFLAAKLESKPSPTVVSGFFSGEGLHAAEDVPRLIRNSTANAIYAGPIGRSPSIPELILAAATRCLAAKSELPAARAAGLAKPAVAVGAKSR